MEHRTLTWAFALGQQVRWGRGTLPWRIVQRRYTERDIMPPLREYGLVAPDAPGTPMQWADEPDLVPVGSEAETSQSPTPEEKAHA